MISIHALLAESDVLNPFKTLIILIFLSTLSLRRATPSVLHNFRPLQISIHALLAESDYDTSALMKCQVKFLSTLSLRRATIVMVGLLMFSLYFYPRSPCGERQRANSFPHAPPQISIHALLAESDRQNPGKHYVAFRFLSTLSLRRATWADTDYNLSDIISIHALLAESDHISKARSERINRFLSTLSLRRATIRPPNLLSMSDISIHALLAESDQ